MKFSVATMVAAIAAVTISAHATTGMPSQHEAASEHVAGTSAAVDTGADADLGSYGRYLMLNGKSRDEAIAEASSIDHPAAHNGSPSHASSHAIVTKAASSQSVQR